MKRIFSIEKPFQVPDGTLISPFLNSKDRTSGLPFDFMDSFSLAAGELQPHTKSKIHVMPHVAQVTFVRSGVLVTKMYESESTGLYEISLKVDQAVLTKPGTFFQLINRSAQSCHVLYIVGPAYLFEMDETGNVIYDDSVVFDESWEELEKMQWIHSKLKGETITAKARQECAFRLASRSTPKL